MAMTPNDINFYPKELLVTIHTLKVDGVILKQRKTKPSDTLELTQEDIYNLKNKLRSFAPKSTIPRLAQSSEYKAKCKNYCNEHFTNKIIIIKESTAN